MSARFLIGDTRAVLATLPEKSVDLVLCSPPFLALRSYLPADHPDKQLEIGSEPTPGEFIDTLLDVVEACARVLTDHGTLAFELGDTYSGSGGAGGDYTDTGSRAGQEKFSGSGIQHRRSAQRGRKLRADGGRYADGYSGGTTGNDVDNGAFEERPANGGFGWPLEKSLCLIPESFRWALVYGRNPFTGRETSRWRARNVVRWCRPNPPVGALGDKFRPGTSEMVIVCKSAKRWFDLDAVRTEPDRSNERSGQTEADLARKFHPHAADENRGARGLPRMNANPAGAPPLDWWEIPTQGYAGSHYATFPEKLVTRPIQAMCPREVCTACGEPRRRLVDVEHVPNRNTNGPQSIENRHVDGGSAGFNRRAGRVSETIGWSDCGHGTFRRGVVLDPFAGSGTTLAVAEGLGRDSIGIDLDERNALLAAERVGMFLQVEVPAIVPEACITDAVAL